MISHQKSCFDKDLSFHASADSDLPLDNGIYYLTRLPFVPITALDSLGHQEEFCWDGYEDMYDDEY